MNMLLMRSMYVTYCNCVSKGFRSIAIEGMEIAYSMLYLIAISDILHLNIAISIHINMLSLYLIHDITIFKVIHIHIHVQCILVNPTFLVAYRSACIISSDH